MRKRFLCFAMSAMLILTFIPQITFAAEDAQASVITGFVPLETSEYYYEGNPEEGDLTVNLPESIGVYLNGSEQPCDIPVTWEAVEDFNFTDFYFYSLKPVWEDGYVLSDTLSDVFDVPWVTVYKQEPDNSDIEPVMTEEELEPLYIGDENGADQEAMDGEQEEPAENSGEDPADGEAEDPADGTETDSTEAPEEDPADGSADYSVRALAGETAAEIIDTLTEDSYAGTVSNTASIYKYLTGTMGLNTAAACGVMININAESAMSPINLQNTYNTLFGLSDKEYTNAVDKGKGSYKTGSGRSQNFKTDSGGYGLCQWTSSGRKTNLLNKAISSGKSIGNIDMQLAFLNSELQNYQQVLTTLKNVPNNAAGAYIAAAEFCLSFEIPANTVNTAASRGKNCLSNYWKTYSGSSASATGTSFISLCGYSYPTAIKTGKGMDVTGYVVSNYSIKSVTGRIIDSNGNDVYSKTLHPGETAYKLSNLDGAMKFSSLKAGTYTYKITAKDSLGKSVTASHKFKVSSSNTTAKKLGFAITGKQESAPIPAPSNDDSKVTGKKYTGNFPKIPSRGYFKKGDKGTQVKRLQKFLKWYGYSVKVDGKYGSRTVKLVKKFQKAVGLKADGQFGKKTLVKAKKVRK